MLILILILLVTCHFFEKTKISSNLDFLHIIAIVVKMIPPLTDRDCAMCMSDSHRYPLKLGLIKNKWSFQVFLYENFLHSILIDRKSDLRISAAKTMKEIVKLKLFKLEERQ